MLDRPIAFHRSFVRLTGSVAAAVMLSQAVYWQKRDKHHDGWWWKPEAEWEDETGLNRREQQTARKHLIKLGCWREDRKGVPAKLWFNLDLDALNNLLHQTVQLAAQNGATGGTDPCNYARASSVVSYLETTSETTPETTHPPEPSPSAPVVSGFEAFWKLYPRRVGRGKSEKAWAQSPSTGFFSVPSKPRAPLGVSSTSLPAARVTSPTRPPGSISADGRMSQRCRRSPRPPRASRSGRPANSRRGCRQN